MATRHCVVRNMSSPRGCHKHVSLCLSLFAIHCMHTKTFCARDCSREHHIACLRVRGCNNSILLCRIHADLKASKCTDEALPGRQANTTRQFKNPATIKPSAESAVCYHACSAARYSCSCATPRAAACRAPRLTLLHDSRCTSSSTPAGSADSRSHSPAHRINDTEERASAQQQPPQLRASTECLQVCTAKQRGRPARAADTNSAPTGSAPLQANPAARLC